MNGEIDRFLSSIDIESSSAVEVSGETRSRMGWRRHVSVSFPRFDVCSPYEGDATYDVVFCEQVLEHVTDPWAAMRTLHDMARSGGHVIVSTPFLVRLHDHPGDYWRFSCDGMRLLMESAGLQIVELGQWGNRRAVRANFARWVPTAWWRPYHDEAQFPVMVWAVARRPT